MSAESGKAAADEIAGMFSPGFFDDKMVSDVAAVVDRHMQTDPVRAALVEALKWYAQQAEGCRKLGSIGELARNALDSDGGQRGYVALRAAGVVLS